MVWAERFFERFLSFSRFSILSRKPFFAIFLFADTAATELPLFLLLRCNLMIFVAALGAVDVRCVYDTYVTLLSICFRVLLRLQSVIIIAVALPCNSPCVCTVQMNFACVGVLFVGCI